MRVLCLAATLCLAWLGSAWRPAAGHTRGPRGGGCCGQVCMAAASEPLILEGLPRVLELRQRPKHVEFQRRRMQLPFAVLLMRSSYQAVDKLRFVPSDEFQKSFFLYRQSEWEDYKKDYAGLMQGDLTDPRYFDHVSYCQYAVIADKMRRGKESFVQLIDANGTAQSMQRDPRLLNNALLPAEHSRLVGDSVLDFIVETYASIIPTGLPFSNSTAAFKASVRASPPPLSDFVKAAQDVLDTLEINSYALNIKVEALPDRDLGAGKGGGSLLLGIRVVGPANLWGSQVLRQRGDLANDFEIKVLGRLADRFNLGLNVLSAVSGGADTTYVLRVAPKMTSV